VIGDRWGVSDGEVARRYPCDEFVREPVLRAWRGCGVPGPVRGWLVRAADGVAAGTAGMRRLRPAGVAGDAAPGVAAAGRADAVVKAVRVRRAVGRLSPSRGAVTGEVGQGGGAALEAAARLGIAGGTAFSRSYYALWILWQELGVSLPDARSAVRDGLAGG